VTPPPPDWAANPLLTCRARTGIGGASAAYFIHRGEPLAEIHLFEKEAFVGGTHAHLSGAPCFFGSTAHHPCCWVVPVAAGRVHSTVIEGAHVEVGASIYHVSNRYFDEFVNELGLKRVEPPNLGMNQRPTHLLCGSS